VHLVETGVCGFVKRLCGRVKLGDLKKRRNTIRA